MHSSALFFFFFFNILSKLHKIIWDILFLVDQKSNISKGVMDKIWLKLGIL